MKRIRFFSGMFWGFVSSIWTAFIFLVGLILGISLIGSNRSPYQYSWRPRSYRYYTSHNNDDDEENDDDE